MSKLIYSMSVSLDGFTETLDRKIDWVIVDEELHTFFNDQAREMGAFIYGRRTYELMVAYWPTADADPSSPAPIIEFTRIWKDMPKIVFSRSLDKVEWNSRLVKVDVAGEIIKLKGQPGKDLGICGPTLASSVIQQGLVDEYRLFVNPIVLGEGMPYFPALRSPIKMRLVETRVFNSGVVYFRYQPDVKGIELKEVISK